MSENTEESEGSPPTTVISNELQFASQVYTSVYSPPNQQNQDVKRETLIVEEEELDNISGGNEDDNEYIDKAMLIAAVHENPLIWQPTHPQYKDIVKKKLAWHKIQEQYFRQHNVDAIKTQWKNLKDGWVKCKTKRNIRMKANTGPWKGRIPTCQYFDDLEFLGTKYSRDGTIPATEDNSFAEVTISNIMSHRTPHEQQNQSNSMYHRAPYEQLNQSNTINHRIPHEQQNLISNNMSHRAPHEQQNQIPNIMVHSTPLEQQNHSSKRQMVEHSSDVIMHDDSYGSSAKRHKPNETRSNPFPSETVTPERFKTVSPLPNLETQNMEKNCNERTPQRSTKTSEQLNDDIESSNLLFCKSLASLMDDLTSEQNMLARIKIQQVLFEVKFNKHL